jgi:stearoyl-CoA desaturase (delta-9 desaturase)
VFGHWFIGIRANRGAGVQGQRRCVQGRNTRFTWLLTMGNAHNNHHAFPGSARLGLFPGEWDPGWWTLLLLCRVGLAWDLRLPIHLPARPEVEALQADAAAARTRESAAGPDEVRALLATSLKKPRVLLNVRVRENA